MKSWAQELGATWLADRDFVSSLDGWVRDRLVVHRRGGASAESVAPWSVELLSTEINRFGQDGRWLWCTSAIAILAELVFCADAGGPFPSHGTGHRYDLERNVDALRVVRNAAFHPAFQNGAAGSGELPLEMLLKLLENDDDQDVREAAERLVVDWSYFASRPVTSYALRMLNSGGVLYAEILRASGRLRDERPRP